MKFSGTYKDLKDLNIDFAQEDTRNPTENVVDFNLINLDEDSIFSRQSDSDESRADNLNYLRKPPCLQLAETSFIPSKETKVLNLYKYVYYKKHNAASLINNYFSR